MNAPAPAKKARFVAPDIARGLALLGIALANLPTAWAVAENADLAGYFGGIYGEATLLEQLAVVFHAMFVHVRGLPMFTTLLGFGIGLITMSLWRRGFPPGKAKRALYKRYVFLALIGLGHLVFLFFGDIIVQYSLVAFVIIAMITLRDRTIMIIAWVLLGLNVVVFSIAGVALSFFPEFTDFAMTPGSFIETSDNYLAYLGFNAAAGLAAVASFPVLFLMLGPLMMIGFVWARRGVLIDAPAHRRLLTTWVAVGAAVVLFIGLPWGLASLGVLPSTWEMPLNVANTGLGLLTGPAALALVALLFQGTVDTLQPWWRAFVALGQRSMSGYILQSLLFLALTQPFTLGWGREAGILPQMGLALGVWLTTLVWAYVWDLRGWPGPVEWVHRRLSYGREGLPAVYQPKELTGTVKR
ncbi:MAG: DUF418 domain-containing protein [Corynebacterium sp.]|uniref:DUF418 domain-containing protein n=1 Tax=Corynebacterium sp. TaxID=1720 RepID=UPI0026E112F5|nr:DUF418 domain-containing protein [Corynebacterium sp.]MDO5671181.1 DUF418 domain-containing protein [Corynebacterium sp.]